VGCYFDQGTLEKGHLVCGCAFIPVSKLINFRSDAKSAAIVAQGCFHPVAKVQSAALHFFLGVDTEDNDSDQEEEVDVRALHHRREINKKTRSGDKKLRKQLNQAKKVGIAYSP